MSEAQSQTFFQYCNNVCFKVCWNCMLMYSYVEMNIETYFPSLISAYAMVMDSLKSMVKYYTPYLYNCISIFLYGDDCTCVCECGSKNIANDQLTNEQVIESLLNGLPDDIDIVNTETFEDPMVKYQNEKHSNDFIMETTDDIKTTSDDDHDDNIEEDDEELVSIINSIDKKNL